MVLSKCIWSFDLKRLADKDNNIIHLCLTQPVLKEKERKTLILIIYVRKSRPRLFMLLTKNASKPLLTYDDAISLQKLYHTHKNTHSYIYITSHKEAHMYS